MAQSHASQRSITSATLIVGLLLFVALSAFSIAKLSSFSYNALDLGIFQQVVANTARGDLFGFTIHPHSYLGDHSEPLLLLIAGVYALVTHPATLLVLQAAVAALGLMPLTVLTRPLPRSWRLFALALYALQPLIHTSTLFEFHMLPFAVPLLLWAILLYQQKRFLPFLGVLLACLMVREDVGLIVMGFGLLAWVEKRPLRWRLIPIVGGLLWFLTGTLLTSHYNHETYKFLAYYGWLGDSLGTIIRTAFTKPWLVLLRLFRLQNVAFLFIVPVLFAGLPLLKLRRLLPTVFVVIALFLTSSGGDFVTLQTHYPALLLPFLFWAAVGGLAVLYDAPPQWVRNLRAPRTPLVLGVCSVIVLYGFFTLSPLRPAGILAVRSATQDPRVPVERALVESVPKDAAVVAGYNFLPALADHAHLYSMNYAFTGRRQLSETPYSVPNDATWLLMDSNDYLLYTMQYGHDAERFDTGDDRLRSLIAERGFNLVTAIDSFLLFAQDAPDHGPLYERGVVAAHPYENGDREQLALIATDSSALATTQTAWGDATATTLPVTLTWETGHELTKPYHLRVQYVGQDATTAAERRYPIAYGLFPTTAWVPGEPVTVHYNWIVPSLPAGTYGVRLQLAHQEGYLGLDPKLTAEVRVTSEELLGDPLSLGTISL